MISCLMPTFNRVSTTPALLAEAVFSFIAQTHPFDDRELIICNDTPGQELSVAGGYENITVINVPERFKTLSDKIQYMIDQADGDYFCRWDDDDISLPHRLAYSYAKLQEAMDAEGRYEWRAAGHWYDNGSLSRTAIAGNNHTGAIWHRNLLRYLPNGVYPEGVSGIEDQRFNALVAEIYGDCKSGDEIPNEDLYYIYRWGVSPRHLSGVVDARNPSNPHQAHYNAMAGDTIVEGKFSIYPSWSVNHAQRAVAAAKRLELEAKPGFKRVADIAHYCDYHAFYDKVANWMPRRGRGVEVGSLSGHSVCYLANKIRERDKGAELFAVDLGVGVEHDPYKTKHPFVDTPGLLQNIRDTGNADMVSVIAAESTRAAAMFADRSLDFVFIDDAHDFTSVLCGLNSWLPKIKAGGLIAGHDYANHHESVREVVDAFFGISEGAAKVTDCENVWCVCPNV